jgi:hypothetical protein
MKTSSEKTPARLSRQTAWGCFTTNLATPGFGSLLAGRKVQGYMQAALMIVGFGVTIISGGRFIYWFITNYSRLYGVPDPDPVGVFVEVWSMARLPFAGIGMFAVAWVWALGTSLAVLRTAPRKDAPPLLNNRP